MLLPKLHLIKIIVNSSEFYLFVLAKDNILRTSSARKTFPLKVKSSLNFITRITFVIKSQGKEAKEIKEHV